MGVGSRAGLWIGTVFLLIGFAQPSEAQAPAGSEAAPPRPGTSSGANAPSAESAPAPPSTPPEGDTDTGSLAGSSVGYIDDAIPHSTFRLRVDAASFSNRPNRAEFFYAAGPRVVGPGLPTPQRSIDYQELMAYLELAPASWLSVFVEAGPRFLSPEDKPDHAGFSDLNAGFKAALWHTDDDVGTFQLRAYAPTGDPHRGLGTGHASLEPGFLLFHRLTPAATLYGEVKDWIAIDGTPGVAGNVLRYGAGISYDVWSNGRSRVTPVIEMVGWTVLHGGEVYKPPIVDATGDTIINLKLGTRFVHRERSELYVGYGFPLTGEFWYHDIVRVEYRLRF